ncbi:RND family transporter [Candidatus Omnitrophota bacterium]
MNQKHTRRHRLLPIEVIAFIIITILSAFCLLNFVSLKPTVENNFFFSSDDPQFQSERLINRLFIRKDSQLVISATGKIDDKSYSEKISKLSKKLLEINGVTSVNSLTHAGPGNLKAALKSPLWKRLIVAGDRKSTNLIVMLDEEKTSSAVPGIEKVMKIFEDKDFHLQAAGLPYVVELIRRNLQKDLNLFGLLTFSIFSFLIFLIFRSKSVLLGTILSCLNSVMWTFKITSLIGIPISILTANLGTIIFVMTLSHIIFLTYNWRIFRSDPNITDPVAKAIERTLPASIWSMLTTLLGFLSLLAVSAKPLRELGHAGALGSLVAIIVSYGVFPAFLKVVGQNTGKIGNIEDYGKKAYKSIDLGKRFIMLVMFVVCFLALPGLKNLDSDPSLLSYFSKSGEIYKGLSYIDQNGGSSPLVLVVGTKSNDKIHSNRSYQKLWNLQESLEQHRGVGSVISLPVLIAQARKTSLLARILPRSIILKALEMPANGEIAKSFVTKDRKYSLFFLRMTESYRVLPRLDVVEEIKSIAEIEGFHPEVVGGIYNLQGHLAKLVASSLVGGLGKLILLFALISLFLSRSLRVTLSVVFGLSIVPLTILGCFGLYRIPLDIISAPASNVAIAMGIDSMIHMINSFRRTRSWQAVRNELWRPILTSMVIVAAGFGIFLFSSFPPTQRFGGAILLGTILAAFTALYVMPLIFEYTGLDKLKALLSKRPKTTASN